MASTQKSTSKSESATATNSSAVADFEKSLDALETLVQQMETGELSLNDSLAAYERGIALYRRCQTALEEAELRVRQLSDPQQPDNASDFNPDRELP